MASFLQNFYSKVYITIIMEASYCDVNVRVEKRGSLKEEKRERFEIQKAEPNEAFNRFVEHYERKSPFSYTTLLNPAKKQGSIPSCTYNGHTDDVVLCLGSKKRPWALFCNAQELLDLQHRFKKTGLDFIMSPFLLLSEIYKKSHTPQARMFVLILDKKLAVTVFQNAVLVYAHYYDLEVDEDDIDEFALVDDQDALLLEEEEASDAAHNMDLDINIDTLDEAPMHDLDAPEDLESLDGLDGLDSLDEIDDINSLDDDAGLTDFEELQEQETPESAEDAEAELLEEEQSLKGFSINYKRFEMLQTAMHDFYHLADVESSFVEEIFLCGEEAEYDDLKGYLEDEIFVSVEIRHINVHEELLKLVKSEVRYAL